MPRRPTIDDTKMRWPWPLRAEDRQRRARAVERAHEVDVHHPPHDLGRRVLDRAVVAEAGVADHDVELPEPACACCDETLHVRLDRDVHRDRLRPAAGGANAGDRFLEPIRPARAEHDRDTLSRERLRTGEADARGRAGDGRDAAGQADIKCIDQLCGTD